MKNLYVEELDYKNIKLQEYVAELKERYKINNKVLLIQTPQFLFESFNIDVAKNRGYYAFPPTGLQTIAKSISSFDLEVNLCDFVITKEGEGKIKFLFDLFYNSKQMVPTNGIFFKLNNKIEETSGREIPFHLVGNLIDTYKNIPIENYQKVGCLNPFSRMAVQNKIFATFQLNRGCRANILF